jgi:hypothetical protein
MGYVRQIAVHDVERGEVVEILEGNGDDGPAFCVRPPTPSFRLKPSQNAVRGSWAGSCFSPWLQVQASPDMSTLATGSATGNIHLWQINAQDRGGSHVPPPP